MFDGLAKRAHMRDCYPEKTKKHLNVPVRYPKDWCGNKSRRHFRSNIIIYGASRMYIDAVQVVYGVSWLRV